MYNKNTCELIGEYEIRKIEPRPKGLTRLVLAIHIDRNCIFMLSAEDGTVSPPVSLPVVRIR